MESYSGINRNELLISYKKNEPWKHAKLKKFVTRVKIVRLHLYERSRRGKYIATKRWLMAGGGGRRGDHGTTHHIIGFLWGLMKMLYIREQWWPRYCVNIPQPTAACIWKCAFYCMWSSAVIKKIFTTTEKQKNK